MNDAHSGNGADATHGVRLDRDAHYLFLEDAGAALPVPTAGFWQQLMSGAPSDPAIARVAESTGWLMCRMTCDADTPHQEMHPAGDEILICESGAITTMLDNEDGTERAVAMTAGSFCIVPAGVWHRQVVNEPGSLLAITFGKGTQHRPIKKS